MRGKAMELSGWGRTKTASVRAWRPERAPALESLLGDSGDSGVIAHGGGRSYGDAALNDGGDVILTGRLNRILAADWDKGTVICEPGVTFGELLVVCLRHGYTVPVSPGTGFATIGGGVANDVHGKNHDRHGSFGDHVLWIDLLPPDGESRRVSPKSDKALFAATLGGVGLTGMITAVNIKLRKVSSNSVELRERPAPDLDYFLDILTEVREKTTFSVGWIDTTARGGALGRGILETAEPAAYSDDRRPPRRRRLPIDMPGFALNRMSVGLFNGLYYRRVPRGGRSRLVPLAEFLYPLDAIGDWNRLYGKRGFHQFQCVLPDAESPAGLRKLLETIGQAGSASFLAVLKTLGGEGLGYLSFPMRGHTLALDFPAKPGVSALLQQLERITLDHGGRIYLAKDSVMSAESFAAMYPKLDALRAVLEDIDPERRLNSDMARRLRIRGDGA